MDRERALTADSHLVAFDAPDLDDPGLGPGHLEPVRLPEDGAAVGARVLVEVEARRVGLGEEATLVAEGRERPAQELEVVHLLKAEVNRFINNNFILII